MSRKYHKTCSSKPEQKRVTYRISPSLSARVRALLLCFDDAEEERLDHCDYRVRITQENQKVFADQFTSGKLYIHGTSPLFDKVSARIQDFLEQSGFDESESKKQVLAVHRLALSKDWIGADESGKGDYFGPLVVGAVFANPEIARRLNAAGVIDSKKLSDDRVRTLSSVIEGICGERYSVIALSPEEYNRRYTETREAGGKLNELLAQVVTDVLLALLGAVRPRAKISILVDQFADKQVLESRIQPIHQVFKAELIQLPKAEANVAVAAASILARARFLNELAQLSQVFQMNLPKGASSPRIIEIAEKIFESYGMDGLRKVAKLHFQTTQSIIKSSS